MLTAEKSILDTSDLGSRPKAVMRTTKAAKRIPRTDLQNADAAACSEDR